MKRKEQWNKINKMNKHQLAIKLYLYYGLKLGYHKKFSFVDMCIYDVIRNQDVNHLKSDLHNIACQDIVWL